MNLEIFSNSVRNPLEKVIRKGLEALSKSPNPLTLIGSGG
jgi:hypothetical protein